MKTTQLKEALKSEIRKVLNESKGEDKLNSIKTATLDGKTVEPEFGFYNGQLKAVISTPRPDSEYFDHEFYNVGEIDDAGNVELTPEKRGQVHEMARIAKTIKISDLEKAQAVIDKVKDTKKKWIADMIQKVIDAGDEGIAQVALAKALGKVDEFGDGRQQAINPEVRSLLGGDVFTFGAAKMEDKPEVTDVTTDDEDEIITSVPDETEDEEIDITNDDVEDSEDEDETEADTFLKPDEDETEDDEEVAKKATPNKRIGSKADQLDAVITDMKKLAADYKKAKTDGDKDKEKEIADKLKEKTKLKKDLEKDIQISLGDETDEDEL